MNDLFNTISDHLGIYFIFTPIWLIFAISFLLWRRRKRGLIFPKVNDSDVVFYEKRASGASHKSWYTKLGGASNCLTVMVTESRLAIATHFPFTAFAGIYDLEHLISISKITEVITKGKITQIEFQIDDEIRRKFSLRLKNPSEFYQVIQQQKASANSQQAHGA